MFSTHSLRVALAALLVAAGALHCASTDPVPTSSTQAPAAVDSWEPVAGYLGSDAATGAKVAELLTAEGIESTAAGSLGYTVNVPSKDAPRAREILHGAVTAKTVGDLTIYEARDLPPG
ncbi:hypothetical protein BH09MYX1_BH09MYX1_02230 [soil metagenome]